MCALFSIYKYENVNERIEINFINEKEIKSSNIINIMHNNK